MSLENFIDRINVQLVRENIPELGIKMHNNITAMEVAAAYLQNKDREYFIIFLLNTIGRITAIHEVSIGTVNTSVVHPREVFKAAILANANSIILAHNHPTGEVVPSVTDIKTTQQLVDAGKLLGISVLDHIIVGNNKCYSFHEQHHIL